MWVVGIYAFAPSNDPESVLRVLQPLQFGHENLNEDDKLNELNRLVFLMKVDNPEICFKDPKPFKSYWTEGKNSRHVSTNNEWFVFHPRVDDNLVDIVDRALNALAKISNGLGKSCTEKTKTLKTFVEDKIVKDQELVKTAKKIGEEIGDIPWSKDYDKERMREVEVLLDESNPTHDFGRLNEQERLREIIDGLSRNISQTVQEILHELEESCKQSKTLSDMKSLHDTYEEIGSVLLHQNGIRNTIEDPPKLTVLHVFEMELDTRM